MKISIGVKDLFFEALHLTQGFMDIDEVPHGHTYRLWVEVVGGSLNSYGYIVDLREIEEKSREVIKELNRAIIVPKPLLDKYSKIKDIFDRIIVIDDVNATLEKIAIYIASKIYHSLGLEGKDLKIRIVLFEGPHYYCVVEYP